jgi:protein-glutamine gamma-glutamyltransferase
VSRRGTGTAPVTEQVTGSVIEQATGAAMRPTRASTRPAGLARGVGAYVAAWIGSAGIALLTGATASVILLAVGVVSGIAGALSGPIALRRGEVRGVSTATVATAGDELGWIVTATAPLPLHAVVSIDGVEVARGWLADGSVVLTGHAPRRGVYSAATVTWSTAGRLGMLWWRRRAAFTMSPLAVGPVPADQPAPAVRAPDDQDGPTAISDRVGDDEVDGVRQWRDGDDVTAVHWPSTLRLGEFVVRQRLREHDERWVVTARSGTGDPDGEAARVRRALDDCMSRGATAAVELDGGERETLSSAADVVRWCAAFEPTRDRPTSIPFWRREISGRFAHEPDSELHVGARWAVAAAAVTPMAMLLQPLGYGLTEVGVVVAALAAGAFVTTRTRDEERTKRQLLGLLVGLVVGAVLVDPSSITSVMTAMRYLMPQLLVALCIVQGFECVDRRGARVGLACSALLAAYAAGVRVDSSLGGFLLVAVAALAVGAQAITWPDRRPRRSVQHHEPAVSPRPARGTLVRLGGSMLAVGAVVGLLAVVPVPKGPAQLTLPAWLSERREVQSSGDLATATGSPLLGGPIQGGGNRTGAGAGGYPGFSNSMDTSLRGDLGDEVVLRVRAPAPDYWRGQTFSEFDGRLWTVESFGGGEGNDGPDHRIPPADGDIAYDGEPDFIQTFYVEVDMPNILFAAPRPMRVLLDATVWYRPDGALRADVVLPAGSAYTVLSHRADTTAEGLRAEGDLSRVTVPDKYLQLPDSTSDRTVELARQLSAGSASTYDTILAIDDWLHEHVAYDLDAPVPPDGADAVDHFLFESQRGFCEQIASATAVMLRSLGVPARIATGYVPSDRDEIAGVWISRARDAHAWVEVWFPSFGWVAFDPTASVPFAGESPQHSIGGELVQALVSVVGDHITLIVGVLVGAAALTLLVRALVAWWRRRRRGRWGVLQDRFVAAAVARGAAGTAPNAELADAFDDELAALVARTLDECAFSPSWRDDEHRFHDVDAAVTALEHAG